MASPKGPPFTVPRYGSLGESIIAERDWLKQQNDQLSGNLSLAEEGLANYAQEMDLLRKRCWALAYLLFPSKNVREAVPGDLGLREPQTVPHDAEG